MGWLDKYQDGGPKKTNLKSLISNSDSRQSTAKVTPVPVRNVVEEKLNKFKLEQAERNRLLALKKKGQSDISNLIKDTGTNMMTQVTEFRTPTPHEIETGRSGNWMDRAQMLSNSTSWGLGNEVGATVIGKGVQAAAPHIKKGLEYAKYDTPLYEFFKPKDVTGLNTRNWQKEVATKIDQRGNFNDGIYNLKRFPNHLLKTEYPPKVGKSMDMPEYDQFNFVNAMKNLPDDPSMGKVYNQFETILGGRGLVMNKVPGKQIQKLTPRELRRIPDEALVDFYNKTKTLRDNDLGFDFIGDNAVYDQHTNKFGIYDITPTGSEERFWQNSVMGGGNRNLYGNKQSGENLKKAISKKFQNDYQMAVHNMEEQAYQSGYYINPDRMGFIKNKGQVALRDRINNVLKDLPTEKDGGETGWLSKYPDGGPKKPGKIVSKQESTRVAPQNIRSIDAYPDQMTADYYKRFADLSGDQHGQNQLRKHTGNAKLNVVKDTRNTVAGRASFNFLNNTATIADFIDYDNGQSITNSHYDLMNELAHAKQLKDNGVVKMMAKNIFRDLPKALMKGSYDSLYDTKGTIENQAHYVIQPTLENRSYEDTIEEEVGKRFKIKFPDGGEKKKPAPYKVKNFMASYMESPEYRKRLANFDDINPMDQAKPNLVRSVPIHHIESEGYIGSQTSFPTNKGIHSIMIDKSELNPKMFKSNPSFAYRDGAFNYEEVLAHEISHASRQPSNKESLMISDLLDNPYEDQARKDYDNLKGKDKKKFHAFAKKENYSPYNAWIQTENLERKYPNKGVNSHDLQPDENKADLDALRYQMYKYGIYDTRKGPIDRKTLEKAMEHPEIKKSISTKRLQLNFGSKDIVKMNNEIASVTKPSGIPIAQNGGQWLDQYPDGGQKKKIQPIPSRTSLQDKIRVPSATEADMSKKMNAYYRPPVHKVTSNNKAQDFLYNNQGLFNVPVVGSLIRKAAYIAAKNSGGYSSSSLAKSDDHFDVKYDGSQGSMGSLDDTPGAKNYPANKLLDQYFGKVSLPKSKYIPKSDYLPFLPTVSLKDAILDKELTGFDMTEALSQVDSTYRSSGYNMANKDKIKAVSHEMSAMADMLNADLGAHKVGVAFDKDRNLPYLSVADAWDFSPAHYAKKHGFREPSQTEKGVIEDASYVQASLMHRAGHPFKIYDRFYFDPKTKKYIPDSKLPKKQKGGQSGWLDKY